MADRVEVVAIPGVAEVTPGDDLPAIIADALAASSVLPLRDDDALVVTQKIVSKAEGATVDLTTVEPRPEAVDFATRFDRDPRQVEVVLREARRIVRMANGVIITETHHGFVCANAAIDASNARPGTVILLPRDPDASARRLQARVSAAVGGRVGVIITDTHGRAFRRGLVNIAIGIAGFEAVIDHRGGQDMFGRTLVATDQAIGDELAAASGLYMGKDSGTPAVVASGVPTRPAPGRAGELVRLPEHDLFRT